MPRPLAPIRWRIRPETSLDECLQTLRPRIHLGLEQQVCRFPSEAPLAQIGANPEGPLPSLDTRTDQHLRGARVRLQSCLGQRIHDALDTLCLHASAASLADQFADEFSAAVLAPSEQANGAITQLRIADLVAAFLALLALLVLFVLPAQKPPPAASDISSGTAATGDSVGRFSPGRSSARIADSISLQISRFSPRKSAAFFLPWPILSPL